MNWWIIRQELGRTEETIILDHSRNDVTKTGGNSDRKKKIKLLYILEWKALILDAKLKMGGWASVRYKERLQGCDLHNMVNSWTFFNLESLVEFYLLF